MKPIAYTLRNYFFTQISIEALTTHVQAGNVNGTVSVVTVETSPGSESEPVTIEVTISTDMEKSENPPYNYKIVVVGLFIPVDEAARTDFAAQMTAIQLLVGAAREMIASTTGSMPWQKFLQGFIGIDNQKIE